MHITRNYVYISSLNLRNVCFHVHSKLLFFVTEKMIVVGYLYIYEALLFIHSATPMPGVLKKFIYLPDQLIMISRRRCKRKQINVYLCMYKLNMCG